MGDLGEGQADTLDERMWGEDEDDDDPGGSDKEEESGPGMDQVRMLSRRPELGFLSRYTVTFLHGLDGPGLQQEASAQASLTLKVCTIAGRITAGGQRR